MSNRMKTAALVVLALAFIALFLFTELRGNIEYVLRSRGEKVTAMVLVGWAGAISTVLFQTITNNRILTPSIIGLDSVYMLIQTAVVFLFGSTTLTMMNDTVHFLLRRGHDRLFGFSVFFPLSTGRTDGVFHPACRDDSWNVFSKRDIVYAIFDRSE